MRWWLVLLGALVVLSVVLAALHPHASTVGEALLMAMERAPSRSATAPRLRTAWVLIDYQPDSDALAAAGTEPLERGDGPLPRSGLSFRPDSHWLRTTGADFTWQTRPSAVDPLRRALAEGSAARRRVAAAISAAGYYNEAAAQPQTDAMLMLTGLTDEQLMMAWLRADRDTLAARPDLAGAGREALLLAARDTAGAVLTFPCRGRHVYIIPQESGPSHDVWLELDAYDAAGRLEWTGLLRVNGGTSSPDPARVRTVAFRVADAALAPAQSRPGTQ